jgi:hypothetical protein
MSATYFVIHDPSKAQSKVSLPNEWVVSTKPETKGGKVIAARFSATDRAHALSLAQQMASGSLLQAAGGVDPGLKPVAYATDVPAFYVIHDPSSQMNTFGSYTVKEKPDVSGKKRVVGYFPITDSAAAAKRAESFATMQRIQSASGRGEI